MKKEKDANLFTVLYYYCQDLWDSGSEKRMSLLSPTICAYVQDLSPHSPDVYETIKMDNKPIA